MVVDPLPRQRHRSQLLPTTERLMTTLHNSISIAAPPEKVWRTLADLEALEQYDPGVARSRLTSSVATGLGASRRCELEPTGWFEERITEWQPVEALTFELSACNLP